MPAKFDTLVDGKIKAEGKLSGFFISLIGYAQVLYGKGDRAILQRRQQGKAQIRGQSQGRRCIQLLIDHTQIHPRVKPGIETPGVISAHRNIHGIVATDQEARFIAFFDFTIAEIPNHQSDTGTAAAIVIPGRAEASVSDPGAMGR
ncbi:hypothetical protein DSECCO2_639540 [anaerobic digester metagenome]